LSAARDAPPVETLERTVAADPGDIEARYRLAAVRLTADDYDDAMARLLEIARRDRDPGFRAGQRTTVCSPFSRCSKSRLRGCGDTAPDCEKTAP